MGTRDSSPMLQCQLRRAKRAFIPVRMWGRHEAYSDGSPPTLGPSPHFKVCEFSPRENKVNR